MRHLIILIFCAISALTAVARPRCLSFDNHDDKVTIVFSDDNARNSYSVSDVTLVTFGREYPVTSVEIDVKDGVATVTLTFPHVTRFSKPEVRLRVNGKKRKFKICR